MPFASFSAYNPVEILDKAVAKINKNTTVHCKFTIKSGGNNIPGSLNTSGRRFKLSTPAGTTWYDGTNMWTANPKSKEITLVNPDAQELRESNPFEYMNTYKKVYNVFFSKNKSESSYLILLNPKSSKSEIKAVQININKKTLLPERFIIRSRNDQVSELVINSISLKSDSNSTDYKCPVSSFSDYELIDLR